MISGNQSADWFTVCKFEICVFEQTSTNFSNCILPVTHLALDGIAKCTCTS